MKIYVKKNGKLNILGEGKIYSKSQLRLNEGGFVATAPDAKNVRQFVTQGSKMLNQNPDFKLVQNQLGQMDQQKDSSTGEGMQVGIPSDADGALISRVQDLANRPENDDVSINLIPATSNTSSDSSSIANESRIVEMRKNAIPFSKKELTSFLKDI